MEARTDPSRTPLALRQKIKNALRKPFTARKDPTPQPRPQDQEPAQESPQEHEAVATQFHLFPYLPTELRLLIWEAATRYKRYVILDPPCNSYAACIKVMLRSRKYRKPWYAGDRRPVWTSRTPSPPLLSVSWEARGVALKTWQRAFAWNFFPAMVVSAPQNLWTYLSVMSLGQPPAEREGCLVVVLGGISITKNYQRWGPKGFD